MAMNDYKVSYSLPDHIQVTLDCICGRFGSYAIYARWQKVRCQCGRTYDLKLNMQAIVEVKHTETVQVITPQA